MIARDPAGRIRVWTARDEELYGWTAAEAIGASYADLLRVEGPEPLSILEQRTRDQGTWEGEIVHRDRWGRRHVLRSRWAACRAPDGSLSSLVEVNSEVTAQLRAERELRERQRDFDAFFRLNGVGNVIVEPQTGTFYTANDAFCDLTGYSADELVHLSARDLTHPDDRERDESGWQHCVAAGRSHYTIEKRYVRKDGRVLWVSVTSTLIRDDAGQPLYGFGVVIDVTARHDALEALDASRQELADRVERRTAALREANDELDRINAKFGALIDASPAAIISLGADGGIEFWNREAERMFGIPESAALGRPLEQIGEWTPLEALMEVLSALDRAEAELHVRTPSGREFELGVWSAPDPGTPGGHVLVLHDNTEKKALERALLEAGEREQRRVGHELHDHLAQQLVGAAFGAQALARELQRAGSPSAQRAADLARLINDSVLDARNLARGINPVEIDSAGLMSALQELALRSPAEARIEMQCPEPVLVHSSETALHVFRIAQDAVANALQHAHARHVVINLDQHDGVVTLTVADDGEPPARELSPGFAIMKYRAQAIHGQLSVEPSPDGGTAVRCTFANQS